MRIIIIHNAVAACDSPDERDVLIQAQSIGTALTELGHEWHCLPCTLDLTELEAHITSVRPQLVFNLVESLAGTGRLIHLVPGLLDALGIPYTGSHAEAVFFTSHKVLAKDRLAAAGLPTPSWVGPFPADLPPLCTSPVAGPTAARWLVKSLWEHASIGIDEQATTLCASKEEALHALRAQADRLGGACFAEEYIDGREFNLALLAGVSGPEMLRPAEIIFQGYAAGRLRIVGYRAKWDEGSYEYHHTPRRFDFPPEDSTLLGHLREMAGRCWQVFGLRGYARVDFRVDAEGHPWILEVNANPCLSPDAGFAAALAASGIGYTAAIKRILAQAMERIS